MEKPKIPQDEQHRLQSLRSLNILDTPAEERFDRLTRLARRLFDVPIALVTLVDEDRQWFKSSAGLDATETPRDISFCGHAINQEGLFIVPDALGDERFSDNPLVTSNPSIRFYGGFPLKNHDGSALGTFCIIDNKPRQISADDLDTLKDLATMTSNELNAVQMATMDELTGICNRRGFMMLANKSLEFCRRQSISSSLIFFDLDKFKDINDTFGHQAGDQVLQDFARLMLETFRESDVIGRLGGDEFAVFLTAKPANHARNAQKRFKNAVDEFNKTSSKPYEIKFSAGEIIINPKYSFGLDHLIRDADEKMYENKRDNKAV